MRGRHFYAGDSVSWFTAVSTAGEPFHIQAVAGRYLVLCFFASTRIAPARAALDAFIARRAAFDDQDAAFFAIGVDPEDRAGGALRDALPGIHFLWDPDGAIFEQLGIGTRAQGAAGQVSVQPTTFVVDHRLRLVERFPIRAAEGHVDAVLACLRAVMAEDSSAPSAEVAPVLVVPRVFERDFCRTLIDAALGAGLKDSGFMQEVDGKTVSALDPRFKRRSDAALADAALRDSIQARIHRRLVPEIAKAFQFQATRIERYIVACYDVESGGCFRPHRDNTTKGTAHRRFAVTINLNAEDYEGGDLRFPEFGSRLYRAPTGGAVVFSCSLLHEAVPVTAGRRFAFLPLGCATITPCGSVQQPSLPVRNWK